MMEMLLITAYHGTPDENIESIEKAGLWTSGSNEWLGEGIYFFESLSPLTDGEKEAKDWVRNFWHRPNWAVFEAEIQSNCYIDLVNSRRKRRQFNVIRKEAIRVHSESHKNSNGFTENIIYIKMVEAIEKKGFDIDFIRAFVDGATLSAYNSYTVRRPQVQVCVRRYQCITLLKLKSRSK